MPGKVLPPGQGYAGRRRDIEVVNISMHRDSAELLRFYGGPGRFLVLIELIIAEYHGKQQARAAQAQEQALVAVGADDEEGERA